MEKDLDWKKIARKDQRIPKGKWRTWLILAGRGFGKTRTGAETIRQWIESGKCKNVALISETSRDVRRVMVEGISGLLSIGDPSKRPKYFASNNSLEWPCGAKAQCFSADRYDQLRGPQFDGAWIDELAKFRNPQAVWDQLAFSLRLGKNPQCVVTTTPRPIPLIKSLVDDTDTHVTRGSTFDNAKNLSPVFIKDIKKRYEGTRLGAQELNGEICDYMDGALWNMEQLERLKIDRAPEMQRIIISIDPAVTSRDSSDETGIIAIGLGQDLRCYVLEDLSGRFSPGEWARRAVASYKRLNADRIVAETNKGGDMVERIIRTIDPTVSYKEVRATRGKFTRAEPVAALYEQGAVSHVKFGLEKLEHQLCTYVPGVSTKSPDRLDALVWGITELALERQGEKVFKSYLA